MDTFVYLLDFKIGALLCLTLTLYAVPSPSIFDFSLMYVKSVFLSLLLFRCSTLLLRFEMRMHVCQFCMQGKTLLKACSNQF